MRAGRMDRRIVIQRASAVANSMGEPIQTWATLATVWAEYQPLMGRERWAAQQVVAEVDTRFRIRWNPDVLPTDRISFAGRIYNILGVQEIGRREGLEIMASSRAE